MTEAAPDLTASRDQDSEDDLCYDRIIEDLRTNGYSIQKDAIPPAVLQALSEQIHELNHYQFRSAGIGREEDHIRNRFIRNDEIRWINGDSPAEAAWLDWAEALKTHINRRTMLGLFSFESHFAHYPPGSFYRRHLDAFRGESNRILSVVAYFNREWSSEDDGMLVLYPDDQHESIIVAPGYGTLVVFLSEEIPHEVRATRRDRFSIAGWYRVNTSTGLRTDPPM